MKVDRILDAEWNEDGRRVEKISTQVVHSSTPSSIVVVRRNRRPSCKLQKLVFGFTDRWRLKQFYQNDKIRNPLQKFV